MSMPTTFAGFGFGAIQSGLFLAEASKTGAFDRLVVAEVNPARVEAIRANNGSFAVNIAEENERTVQLIEGVEIYNPTVPEDATALVAALAEAREMSTALPSVDFFDRGTPSVAGLLRQALLQKIETPALPSAVIYTAENNNHAAEHLEKAVFSPLDESIKSSGSSRLQMLNTVIGKMSSVVTDPQQILDLGLTPVVPGAREAFLVESFNRILISSSTLPDFQRQIHVFSEKQDLLPFEEAKLYGHNAIHALLGYLANERGLGSMSDLANHPDLIDIARGAFLEESGVALIKKYQGIDPLFTEAGMTAYAEDLLKRMLNPFLNDPVDRIIRDPQRKLAWNDRLIGAMRLTLRHGIQPIHLSQGVKAAMHTMTESDPLNTLRDQWIKEAAEANELAAVIQLLN